MYVPTNSEIIVSNILLEKGINSLYKLNVYDLSQAFGIQVWYEDVGGILINKKAIVLDKNKSHRDQYVQFAHELGHFFRDDPSFQQLEDWQHKYVELKVNRLMLYITMPYFLLDIIVSLGSVEKVAQCFYVNEEMARKRLEGIRNRMRGDIYASVQGQENRNMVLQNQLYY